MAKLRVHIGHHYFGAGNLGDDLMLAGFLEATRPARLENVSLTCCTPHDADSQRLRFPEVMWLPYDEATRAAAVARCDVWLGLGDTPFQIAVSPWFLEHLTQEAATCRRHGKPMFYLGVGVNEREAAADPRVRLLVGQAEKIWTRDADSAGMLEPLATPGKISVGADLAHIALAGMRFAPPEPDTLGLLLNFEDSRQYHPDQIAALIGGTRVGTVAWLTQEVRPLDGSETALHTALPASARERLTKRTPDYAGARTAAELVASWGVPAALFTSRYHGTLIGAWMGCRTAVFARSDKVAGGARQLGLPPVENFGGTGAILDALATATPVAKGLLHGLAQRSASTCDAFFDLIASRTSRRPAPAMAQVAARIEAENHPPGRDEPFRTGIANGTVSLSHMTPTPRRILFLRPDAFGDLLLFEPVLRIVRDAWPQTEVGVLIREPYRDIVPLLDTGGVRWLTTSCDPYRKAPADDPAAFAALGDTVRAFAPDCMVAACSDQTWLESAVAAFLPDSRQIGLGPGLTDPLIRAALGAVFPVDWTAIYPQKIPVEPETSEWERNLRLASTLLGREAPRWWPVAHVPPDARARARRIVADAGLTEGRFVACAAAGTANVQIKTWPAASFGEVLASLEKEHGVRALLIGHISESERLEEVRQAARAHGGDPALWTGQDGEMPVVAGLLEAARFYFGHDTGTLHLAAALGRPVVSIFGGGHWPRFRPVAAREMTMVQPLPCFGCAWECDFGDAPCVRTISTASVRRALGSFLAADATAAQTVYEAEGLEAGARAMIEAATPRLRFLRSDGQARLRQVGEFAALLAASEADRAARLQQIEELGDRLAASETDRAARLQQIEELGDRLAASETDRAARGQQVEKLTALLATGEADRAARLRQIEVLTTLLAAGEADRAARLHQVEELTTLLAASEADRAARLRQIEELTTLLATSEADRAARLKNMDELTALLAISEADRAARLENIGKLTEQLTAREHERLPLPPVPDQYPQTTQAAPNGIAIARQRP